MTILVSVITINRRGQPQREERRLEGSPIVIGRGSQSHIHLPDARVGLEHARIIIGEGGATIEAVKGTIDVNDRAVQRANLAVGDRVQIGPYEITVEEPPSDLPLAIAIKQDAGASGQASMVDRVLLSAPRLSKRRLSYLLFFGVLFMTLVVPTAVDLFADYLGVVHYRTHPATEAVMRGVSERFAVAWNPGTLSQSHQVFGNRECRTCHQIPFVQVRDHACLQCHKSLKEHVPRTELTGPKGIEFAETRCAECHRDHKGRAMAPRSQELCDSCHADIRSTDLEAHTKNVTDFASDHPQFRLSLLDAERPDAIKRVRQDAPKSELVERSNLKFNHKIHVDPKGIRDPDKKLHVLKCEDCHRPDDGGRLMSPVTFEEHCQSCHSLAFEPQVTKRQVPHGSEEEVLTTLREFYARLVLGDVPPDARAPADLPRMRPGAEISYPERQQALRIADARAQRVLDELYDKRKVCSTCHFAQRERDGWKVAPVRVARVWMPNALFSHAKHSTEKCATCHDVYMSTQSKDIAMPNVDRCRECHVGGRPVMNMVTSDCAMCHKFHAGRDYWSRALQLQAVARTNPK